MENNYKKARIAHEGSNNYTDFSNVEVGRRYLVPEEIPEGAYGSPFEGTLEKTTPWKKQQRTYSAYNYEYKALHADFPRKYPGAHPVHDDPDDDEEYLYTSR